MTSIGRDFVDFTTSSFYEYLVERLRTQEKQSNYYLEFKYYEKTVQLCFHYFSRRHPYYPVTNYYELSSMNANDEMMRMFLSAAKKAFPNNHIFTEEKNGSIIGVGPNGLLYSSETSHINGDFTSIDSLRKSFFHTHHIDNDITMKNGKKQ